jgi:hypothetical protein
VARELSVNFRSTSGPVIAEAGDLAARMDDILSVTTQPEQVKGRRSRLSHTHRGRRRSKLDAVAAAM